MADFSISHDWQDETLEAKARWFQSLSPPERLDMFFSLMDLILEINPAVADCECALTKPRVHCRVNIDAAFLQSRPPIVPALSRTDLVSLTKSVISL